MYGEARWYRRYKNLEPVLDIAQSEQYEDSFFVDTDENKQMR